MYIVLDDVFVVITANGHLFLQTKDLPEVKAIEGARVLLNLGDSVTTDHISPAGSIARNSPAAKYLVAKGSVHQHKKI